MVDWLYHAWQLTIIWTMFNFLFLIPQFENRHLQYWRPHFGAGATSVFVLWQRPTESLRHCGRISTNRRRVPLAGDEPEPGWTPDGSTNPLTQRPPTFRVSRRPTLDRFQRQPSRYPRLMTSSWRDPMTSVCWWRCWPSFKGHGCFPGTIAEGGFLFN